MMWRSCTIIAAAVVALGCFVTGAAAAERPWAGFYLGGTLGHAWAHSEHCDGSTCSGGAPTFPQANPSGVIGGVTAGYNYMFGSVLLGIEGDYTFANLKDSSPDTGTFGCRGECTTELDRFGTIRGRLGVVNNNMLLYATWGVALTRWSASIGAPTLQGGSDTQNSAVVGGGVEFLITPQWSAKFEYLRIFDGDRIVYAPSFCGSPGCSIKNEDADLVRVGVNYHFR
jgi:outer membrane immunogenic protein